MYFQHSLLSATLLASIASAGLIKRDDSTTSSTCTAGTQVLNGRNCAVSCGVDRAGGDYSSVQTLSLQGCAQACAADLNCVTAQYHEPSGFCYLKNVANTAVSSDVTDTVDCDGSSSSSSTTTTTTTTTSAAPTCTATSLTVNHRSCQVSCSTDRPGGDYGNAQTNSLSGCLQACAADSSCVTAQYDEANGYCYFKNTANTAVSADGIDTVDCAQPACSFYATSTGTYSSQGQSFTLYDNTFWNSYTSADKLGTSYPSSYQGCANQCIQNSACKFFNFYKYPSTYCELFAAKSGGYCWGASGDFISGSMN